MGGWEGECGPHGTYRRCLKPYRPLYCSHPTLPSDSITYSLPYNFADKLTCNSSNNVAGGIG